nr:endo-1,4-beta-xylanase [uncultured bacterium]
MNDRRKVLELFEEQKEFLEEKISSGIDKYRKGYGNIVVKDKRGNPVSNIKIKLKQKTHEFKFGANLFMLDELETDEKNQIYKKCFADVFNMATLPFYWEATEPGRGKTRYDKNSEKIYRRPAIDLCIEFCEKHGIEPREHALAYERFFPKWLYDASVSEIKLALEKRFSEISERYKDKIPTIEVTNEMAHPEGKTAFYNEPDFVEWCFKTAEKYFPSNQLVINEWTRDSWEDNGRATDKYYSYIEANKLKGARIDAIGLQYHIHRREEVEYERTRLLYNPEALYKRMDLYSNFGLPLQITEVTVPAYSYGEEGEKMQAEIIEMLYSIWFSHPNVEQIIYWNTVDGYAHLWDPDPVKIKESQGNMTIGENYYYGGLLRYDMTPKPAYFTIKNLIQEKWHTEEKLITNASGEAKFKGFYGKYDVEIKMGEKTITKEINLTKKGNKTFNIEV